jgi:SagB-type dehydrogenase family enzyme
MKLPEPRQTGPVSLEESIAMRRSVRTYNPGPVTIGEVSQLLWAAQGITGNDGFRAAPSGGATYPLGAYLIAGNVTGLEPGMYRYDPASHSLSPVKEGDLRVELSEAALGQPCVRDAAAIVAFSAIYERTTERYGDRGKMYVHMDAGHAAENLLLQATALGLGGVPVGAFRTRTLAGLLGFSEAETPLYLIPIGRR